jgi:hypothetical protein
MHSPRFASPRRHVARLRGPAAIAVLVTLTIGAPVAALQADPGRVNVKDITIVGTPTLYVERPAEGAGPNVGTWVVFRARPHLRVVRQVVVEVRGLLGHSHTGRGARDCIRSTILRAGGVLKPGSRYRVRFYGRPGRAGKAETLLATHTLTAHTFPVAPGHTSVPRCRP